VITVTLDEPLPRSVTYDHLPSPMGSSPFSIIQDTQLSQIMVLVPPGWNCDGKSSGERETATAEWAQMRRIVEVNVAYWSGLFQLTFVSGKLITAAP
jgi:hypothetical protein